MKAIVICPADRTAVGFLARQRPLALVPVLGRSLLDLTLADLAHRGARQVLVLAADRPELVRAAVGGGEAWGVTAVVQPVPRELSVGEARARHQVGDPTGWLAAPHDITVVDRLPGQSATLLFPDYGAWFAAVRGEMIPAAQDRMGIRELAPGVYVGLRAQISPTARLVAPCWVGNHAWIGEHAIIGPGSIVERGAYVDEAAEVVESFVGPETYVGALTEVRRSFAWGHGLLQWESGSFTEVVDEFLLTSLERRAGQGRGSSWTGRLAALLALLLTWPMLGWAWWRNRGTGRPLFAPRQAVRAPVRPGDFAETVLYHELAGLQGLARRWPELWRIARGDFAWVGNRPLTREQAATLTDEFERLWLAVPPGLVSLADLEGTSDPFGDEARVHAGFYAVRHNWREDLRMLARLLRRRPAPL